MNLYIRLLILLLTAWRRPKVRDIVAGCSLNFRVLPNDLDTNMHMNNGRYLTVMDLGRVDMVLRAGLFGAMLKRGCLPVLASASVRWRLPLVLFRPYRLETRVVCWDEKWVYLEQRFVMVGGKKDNAVAAIGILKGSFWDKKKKETVPTSELLQIIGLDRLSPPIPDHIAEWQRSEEALKAVTSA
jgi:acyl-CoA thioesterase FadM